MNILINYKSILEWLVFWVKKVKIDNFNKKILKYGSNFKVEVVNFIKKILKYCNNFSIVKRNLLRSFLVDFMRENGF